MVPIEAFVPYDKGDLLNDIHKVGMVEKMVSVLFNKRCNFFGIGYFENIIFLWRNFIPLYFHLF